jgi:hypothetical protein
MNTFGWSINISADSISKATSASSGSQENSAFRTGILAGTRLASNLGWRAVEKLAVGDKLLTFDNGMQVITDIRRRKLRLGVADGRDELQVVVVPAGALGNRNAIGLAADHGVMLEAEDEPHHEEDPFSVVPARILIGLRGIHGTQADQEVDLITLVFAHEEVIYAEGGLLLHCAAPLGSKAANLQGSPYRVLGAHQSRDLIKTVDLERNVPLAPGGYVFGSTEVGLVA